MAPLVHSRLWFNRAWRIVQAVSALTADFKAASLFADVITHMLFFTVAPLQYLKTMLHKGVERKRENLHGEPLYRNVLCLKSCHISLTYTILLKHI